VGEHYFQYLKMKVESGPLTMTPKGTAMAEKTIRYRAHQVNVLGIIGLRAKRPTREMDSRIPVMVPDLFFCLIFT
jgi:hypothetical protein